MPKITIDKADRIFSQFVRLRDMECMRCHSGVRLNDAGMPVSHTNSHYFGRGREATRFDPENCDTLCMACHMNWGSADKESYREFKVKQLTQRGFDELAIRANTYKKKDRTTAFSESKRLLDSLS